MPYPKTSSGYSVRLRGLVEEVVASNAPMVVECASERQARGLRAQYYQYQAAVKRDCERPPAWMTPVEVQDLKDFLRRLMAVQFSIAGSNFIVQPRDESPTAKLLEGARPLTPTGEAPTAGAEASLQRLLEKTRERS